MDRAVSDHRAGDLPASGTDDDRASGELSKACPFDRRVIWVGGIVFAVLMAL